MAEDEKKKIHPRWTDNPFVSVKTPEQKEWIRKRDEAIRLFREKGDDSMAVEIGLFPPKKKAKSGADLSQTADIVSEVKKLQKG